MPTNESVVVLILMGFLAVYIGPAQAAWIQASQERVTTTARTLGNIKWLKISGLNDVAFSIIRSLRIKELKVSTRFRMLLGASLMLGKRYFLPSAYSVLKLIVYKWYAFLYGLRFSPSASMRLWLPMVELGL